MGNNKKISKSMLLAIFAENFAETPKNVKIWPSGRMATFSFGRGRKTISAMIDYRTGDQWYPQPIFLYTEDFMADAKSVCANFTIAICPDNVSQTLVINHRDLKFVRDDDGQICGIYGFLPAE